MSTSSWVVRWKVADLLKRHNKTPYALIKASGLSQTSIYRIASGKGDRVEFDTLVALADGIERLTGDRVNVGDLLEIVPA